MSLVLIVIGLILGAVSIGKDMQRNAEYKKIKLTFIDEWVRSYNQFYDRIGVVVEDDPAYPTNAVNYSDATGAALTQLKNIPVGGFSFAQSLMPALCGNDTAASNDLHNAFTDAGIEIPSGRAENQEDKYLYLDSNGNPQQITICFQWLLPVLGGSGNSMIITGLTADLAKMLDVAIDGRAEGTRGKFRYVTTPATGATADWPVNNSSDIASMDKLTAYFRMIQ